MSAEARTRVLWVDDHAEIRRLFRLILEEHAEFETVEALDSADNLEESVERLRPDVVVLDLSMPGRRPVDAMKGVKSRFPAVQFLISSSFDDEAMVQEALNSGATGYLVKETAFERLAEAVRQVAKGVRVTPQG